MCWQIEPRWPLGLYIYWNDRYLFSSHNTETEALFSLPYSASELLEDRGTLEKLSWLSIVLSAFCPILIPSEYHYFPEFRQLIAEPSPHFSLNQVYEWVSYASCIPRCAQRSCRSLMQQHTFKTSSADLFFFGLGLYSTQSSLVAGRILNKQCVLTDSQQLFFLSSCFCDQLECSRIMSPTICRM